MIKLKIDYTRTFNYALHTSDTRTCKWIDITNMSGEALHNIVISVSGDNIKQASASVAETLEPGQTIHTEALDFCLTDELQDNLPEHLVVNLILTVSADGKVVHEEMYDLEHDSNDLSQIYEQKHEVTKYDIWERKLLDFSLRNSLLNLSLRRKATQLISCDIDKIEDNLQDGEEYCILPKPENATIEDSDDKLLRLADNDILQETVRKDMERHCLHTYHAEGETTSTLKNIYRAARNAIEETGANSLFLTIGTLRWYESDSHDMPRYAPLMLMPIEMVYKKGNYYIRSRDEELTFNITLIEFLRQNYGITINGLDPLPKDDSGVDVKLIFSALREAFRQQPRWVVEEECIIGTFSFSKFLMWNDVHNNREQLSQNNIVNSLVNNSLTWQPQPLVHNLKNIDSAVAPTELALPVPVDSSQMAAVIEGGKGNSFILYGPPGTGKSQTITNLIANALFQGRRVLFVAEKMAALSVVQSRLAKIGLDPFCLELHSNKSTKRHVLEQLDKALKVTHIVPPSDYEATANKIFESRKLLIDYITALHNVDDKDGMSLYDCIMQYESIDSMPLDGFKYDDRINAALASDGLRGIEHLLTNSLDATMRLVGQPSAHPLNGLHVSKDMVMQPEQEKAKLEAASKYVGQCVKESAQLSQALAIKQTLLRDNSQQLLQTDSKALYDEWRSAKAKWFIPRFFAKRNFVAKMRQYNKFITADGMDQLLDSLMSYQDKHASILKLQQLFGQYTQTEFAEDEMPDAQVMNNAIESLDRWAAHTSMMRDWLHWSELSDELRAKGMACVVSHLERNEDNANSLCKAYTKALMKHMAQTKMNSNAMTATFEGMIFDEKVKLYRQMAEEYQLLTQKELYARLASRIPRVTNNIDSSSEIGLLNRNISNGGRGLSLRMLFDQIPTLLPRLCPCMLMSPMSVAQYLDLNQEKFDLVVFDEASQMPTSEAVGAIARGKSLIVVGDPKQMPPTSFFSSTNVDEDEAFIDDMESILEDCRTLEIPALQLNWHYRSRHESLIAFSNKEYYDGSLITFPSTDDQRTKVRYIPVDGCYDKGGKRSNKAEAEAIVEEIKRRLNDSELSQQSIGVIAFSVVQQSLIEDILQDALDADKSLAETAAAMYEPIFVKNLENVQGDERDVILFSIGYGPDKDGKVSMNFGPLNNAGGERRLNVAVSRARQEMCVFSTLKASQIDLRRTKAKGVEGLKHFLEYAESQVLDITTGTTEHESNTIAEQIADALNKRGYIAHTGIGRSKFKVDVAVSESSAPELYKLAILLDGEGYRDTQTTRDREIVQPSVLDSLKWNVMRVWSIDWFNNPERVLDRIEERMTEEPVKAMPAKKMVFDITKEKEAEIPTLLCEYAECKLAPSKASKMSDRELMKQIVASEQPVTFMQICRRAAALRGLSRVTPTLQKDFEQNLSGSFYTENDRGSIVVWMSKADSEQYKCYRAAAGRDIADIPMAEIRNVVREAISEQFALQTDNLSLIVAKKLGFTRRGTNVDSAIKMALQQLIAAGEIQEDESKLRIC